MFITSREKAIIELIIKTSGKHTAYSIATFLNVSVRTIQRDLKAVEKILQHFDIRLTRNTHEGLGIEGKDEQIFRLIQHLTGSHPIDQTPQERKLLLLLALFQDAESFKIQSLATALGVSITTLTVYLDELTEWLKNYNLELSRKRGVGVELNGNEGNKRKALTSYFLLYFNEELIESLFLLEKGTYSKAEILHFLRPDYVLGIDRLANETLNNRYSRLADSDYIGLVVHFCISMQRIEQGFLLEEEGHTASEYTASEYTVSEYTTEYSQIQKICTGLEETFSVAFSQADIRYLVTILRGSKHQEADAVPYDSVVLGQMIKNVIQYVSSQLHVDLTKDFSLFQGLLAHMEPSLFRIQQQMGLFNPLTEEIKRKYPVLFLAVKNSVEKEFKEIEQFPDDEIAFIVLHFGSALVLQEEEISIKALVVCPTGIGTSKMLASRVKKEIQEIDAVEIKSIKEIQQQENLDRFDVIISTVRLPFIPHEYILVNPLLSTEDITAIRSFLQKNIENVTKHKKYKKRTSIETASTGTGKAQRSLEELLQELKSVQQSIEAILQYFRVYRMPQLQGYVPTLVAMLEQAQQEKLISDATNVLEALQDRQRKGGLGIPHTGMGLFHCRSQYVHKLIFQIAHLEEPWLVQGMDGQDMYMKTILLMLAPEELNPIEQEMISLLSTSLIESNEAIMIFSSSNEEVIRSKLESIFLEYLHTNLLKE